MNKTFICKSMGFSNCSPDKSEERITLAYNLFEAIECCVANGKEEEKIKAIQAYKEDEQDEDINQFADRVIEVIREATKNRNARYEQAEKADKPEELSCDKI